MQTSLVTAHTGLTTRNMTAKKNPRQIIRLVSGRLENKQRPSASHCLAHWIRSQHLKLSLCYNFL